MTAPESLDEHRLAGLLSEQGYFADEGLLTAVHLALRLGKPLLLEGEPGVGKTELASVMAPVLGRPLIRLQCFEGLDSAQALYEWDHPRQLLRIREAEAGTAEGTADDLYSERFLLARPLLRAVTSDQGTVLLIDEIDRADSEFEAFLLEFLGDFQITIPELGTLTARRKPFVVLSSNRTRELHGALKRRCLYHWIDFPGQERERSILAAHVPGLDAEAADRLVRAVTSVRNLPLLKRPGIAETVEWARGGAALVADGAAWPPAMRAALGLLVKDEEDTRLLAAKATELFGDA
ncbi:ATPase [Prauserella marina]|uniref:MoxR-like ATPase n=1 Tax=Prauserella marina TaxID=530584 RepID=A0A222VQK5_9PSEU|nr:MoxR family ATPase [Prauserella marina]ASR36011.1 ATPase [Prauserella marina]PWV84042.1 MoxR-like ATPase [Prauserella marina]SDC31837.1 MoxR-like ATPase [Prauserella marina]